MGTRTNTAALRVAEQRQRLGESIAALDAQVRRDVRGVGSGIAESAGALGDRIVQQAEDLPGAEKVREQATRHPLSALLAAFGAGVALGVTSEELTPNLGSRASRGSGRARANEQREAGGNGMLGALTGGMLSSVTGPLGDELRTMLREAVTGFLGERRGEREHPPEEQPSAGESREVPRAA
jgi:hypothetical protein